MKVSYAPYRLFFKVPSGTSRGIMTYKDTYFIKLWDETDPSQYGIGECALFKGLSFDNVDDYENKLNEVCKNIEDNKPTDLSKFPSIRFGLESAIYDYSNGCKKEYFKTPFTKGESKIIINGLVWMGTKQEMEERVAAKIRAGFKSIKIKVGAIDFNQELEIIDKIRCKYGPDKLELRLDANGGFNIGNALQRLKLLSQFDIHSIEQPIKAGQWNEMGYLCENSPIPIALDEELIGIFDETIMKELLTTIHPKYIIIKPSLLGGFAMSEDWLKLASKNDVGGWVTSALESNIGLNAIAQWVSTLDPRIPQGLGTGNLYTNNISSPLIQEKDYLFLDKNKSWSIPEFSWK